ncbi:MAG: SDR family oxidoreductase [Nitrospinaceae bacterium]|jgi:nucleoside-diphosphate-sugar epimerase|nr:SDR family oxidoreductase [Nitrospinaceae bacterium]MBT3435542.1 SDR family oxidoreductase [Nitrospinaceae bacterium]MBT3822510.1 SDR family oxidoreductase [Nitrospinaceae bacterium]MBT4095264.1 SDR family oxidoreductase [Nitrospinaceae bacterium]MBT4431833.1 SDR family oxidoreductase [Nitrospinaceae bacterium]
MESVLVTGGGGFIGSHLVRELLEQGYAVRLLDNFFSGRRENIEDILGDIELIDDPEGLLSVDVCERAVRDVDFILHQGAVPSVPRSLAEPVYTDRVNVGGTVSLLEAARKAGVSRFVYASSSSVYGDAPGEIRCEDGGLQPLSPYAVSKLAMEMYAVMYHRLHGLETVGLRYFNVFGPRQDPESQYAAVVPIFTRELLKGKSPKIFGDGEQSRDFTYIDNVVSGNILAMKADGAGGEVFNMAAGDNHSVNELFSKLCAITGTEGIDATYAPARKGDVFRSQANVSKAKEILKFEVLVSFDEGLRHTVEWYQNNADGVS